MELVENARASMSDFEKSREISRFIRANWYIFEIVQHSLPLKFYKQPTNESSEAEFMTRLEKYFAWIPLASQQELKKLISEKIQEMTKGRKDSTSLFDCLESSWSEHMQELEHMPNSLEKAEGFLMALIDFHELVSDQELDAMCLLNEQVDEKIISGMVRDWKRKYRKFISEAGKLLSDPSLASDIFWKCSKYPELDMVSRYRFMDIFNIHEFDSSMRDIESIIAGGFLGDFHSGPLDLAFAAFFAGRSEKLCEKIMPHLHFSLFQLASMQLPGGYWENFLQHPGYDKDDLDAAREPLVRRVYTTALASATLLRHGTHHDLTEMVESGRNGVRWLVNNQGADGSWNDWVRYSKEDEETRQFFVTLLAAEAIRRSGLERYKHSLEAAEEWLLKNQDADGQWQDENLPFPFMTVLVLEYFQWVEEKPAEAKEASEKKTRPIKRTKYKSEEKKTRALLLLKKYPNWTDTRIAEVVGVNRTTVYNWPEFKLFRASLKAGIVEKYQSALDLRNKEKAKKSHDREYLPPEIADKEF
jgi:hypothetical protein